MLYDVRIALDDGKAKIHRIIDAPNKRDAIGKAIAAVMDREANIGMIEAEPHVIRWMRSTLSMLIFGTFTLERTFSIGTDNFVFNGVEHEDGSGRNFIVHATSVADNKRVEFFCRITN